MSLMNDALRKKNREITASPAAPGFSDASQRPRTNRKWFAVLAAIILLTAATLAGIHLMQSAPDKALRVKNPLPTPSRPPLSRAADTTSAAQQQADVTPIQASAGGKTETKSLEDTPKENRLTTTDLESTPPPSAVKGNAPDTRSGESASATESNNEKPAAKAVSQVSTINAAPTLPRSPANLAPSPLPRAPTETIGERKAAEFDQDRDLFYKKALAYHRNGRLADAIRLYQQVLKSNSGHPGALLNLAAAYMQRGNYADAHPLLKRLEQSTPRPQGVLLNLAIAAIGMGAPEKALDYLDRAKTVSDASPWEIRFHRAVAFTRMNRLPEALALYREAETERPDDPRLQFNLAVTCDALGLYPEALAHYEAVVRTSPESSATDTETIIRRMRTIQRYLGTAQSPAKRQ